MKLKLLVVLTIASLVLSYGSRFAWADDVSDLKAKIEALESQVSDLKVELGKVQEKQQVQAQEVKKVPELERSVEKLKAAPAGAGAMEGTTIGGHLKFFLADQSFGKRNGDHQKNTMGAGMGSHALYLFLGKEMTDALKLDVGMDIRVTASATPSLGNDIDRATTGSIDTSKMIYKANLTYLLPGGAEVKAGLFNPMFSEEYAKETWWHELYHQSKGLSYLQSWHDTGIELYKNYDFDKWSLPVYLSILNGATTQYTDNNSAKTVLLHIAPELFQTRLRFLGSLGFGNYGSSSDTDVLRYVAGFDWKYQKFNLTGELIGNKYDDIALTTSKKATGENNGGYIRALYHFTPELAGLVKFSRADLYKTSTSTMLSDNYDATELALDYDITPGSTIIAQYEIVDANRSDGSEKLDYNRYTLGWRTTF